MPAPVESQISQKLLLMEGRVRWAAHRGRWIIAIGLAIFFIVASRRLQKDLGESTHEFGGTALSDYLESGRRVFSGDLYEINFSYPPAFAVGMLPFTFFSNDVSAVIWIILQFAAMFGCGYCLWKLLKIDGVAPAALGCLAAVVVNFRFYNNNLVHGNINSFVLLFILLAALAEARGRGAAAGFWAAAAATLKLIPLFYLFIFLARRSWRAAGSMALFLILLNVALPAAVMGPARAEETARQFYQKMIEPFYKSSSLGIDPRNLALSAALKEHLEAPAPESSPSPPRKYDYDFQIAQLPAATVNWISKLILGAIASVSLWSIYKNRAANARAALAAASIALLCLLLISPKTWTAHYVWLFPAQLLIALEILQNWGGRSARARLLRWGGIAATVILAFTSKGILGGRGAAIARALSVETIAVGIYWVLLCLLSFRDGAMLQKHQNVKTSASAGESDLKSIAS